MSARNVELTREAGRLRAAGMDTDRIERELLNHPSRNGLPASECRSIARSIGKKPPGRSVGPPASGRPSALHELADRRRWPVAALKALGAVAKGAEVHIPMKLADGRVVGWRRRRANGQPFRATGSKAMSVRGSRAMLVMPAELPPGIPIAVVESETDATAIIAAGHSAVVATPGGQPSVNCIAEVQKMATGRTVVLFPDPDEVGDAWRRRLGGALLRAGCRVLFVPPVDCDIDERLRRDPDPRGALARLVRDALPFNTAHSETPEASAGDEPRATKSAATVLVEIAQERYRFGVSQDGETYAVPLSGAEVVATLRGNRSSLRGQLAREYFRRTGRAAPQQALADALLAIDGMAQEADPEPLHLRVARHEGALWIDLGGATGRAIKVAGNGWTIEHKAPVLFKRTALTGVLPEPISGGTLDDLWVWVNVAEADRPLVAAWEVATFFPDIPHPVLGMFGQQGAGKTTAQKVVVWLLDPSPVPTRKPPKDQDSWVTAAAGSWVVGIDNLSHISPWLADSLCRAVTGEGDVRRKLYTDSELAVFAFRRCVIINGIDLGAIRGDLADRMLPITLNPISEEERREEEDLWSVWQQVHPRLLGAILDLVASVMHILPSVRFERKPRMADFARVLAAVDYVLGTKGLASYIAKQGEIATDSLTDDVFISRIAETVTDFTGTAAELRAEVTPTEESWRAPKGWPGNARAVTQLLNRQAPVMRKAGWTVEHDGGRNHTNSVRWTIVPPPEMVGNSDSQNSQDSQDEWERESRESRIPAI
jgi:primase-like protein